MKLHVTGVAVPPPHLTRTGEQPERFTKVVDEATLAEELKTFARNAFDAGLFDAGGCLTFVIQRARALPATDGRPA